MKHTPAPPTIPATGRYVRFVRANKRYELRSGFVGYLNGEPITEPHDTWAEANEAVNNHVYTLITHAHGELALEVGR